jgi:hypothetical protein
MRFAIFFLLAMGGTGCSSRSTSLFPLETGHVWTYSVGGMRNGCADSGATYDVKVRREVNVSGRQAFEVEQCGRVEVYSVVGDKVELHTGYDWAPYFDSPAEGKKDGDWTWTRAESLGDRDADRGGSAQLRCRLRARGRGRRRHP